MLSGLNLSCLSLCHATLDQNWTGVKEDDMKITKSFSHDDDDMIFNLISIFALVTTKGLLLIPQGQ